MREFALVGVWALFAIFIRNEIFRIYETLHKQIAISKYNWYRKSIISIFEDKEHKTKQKFPSLNIVLQN